MMKEGFPALRLAERGIVKVKDEVIAYYIKNVLRCSACNSQANTHPQKWVFL
jgi:hypothetical protein